MFESITGNNMNTLTLNAYEKILTDGRRQSSRNGGMTCLNNVVLNLLDPKSRHLYLEGRKSHIAAQIAETFWIMAGDNRVDPYLSFFLPRAKDYSDDGETWHGAYGPRLYAYNQLQDAVDVFLEEGWDTRRSIIQILLPEIDSKQALEGYGIENCKDRPCNNELVFFMKPVDGTLNTYTFNMNVFQRSGDAIWGTMNINAFEWTFLMELMCNTLNRRMKEDIVLGEYTHFVTNLHIYDMTSQQAVDAVELNRERKTGLRSFFNMYDMTATNDVGRDRAFFAELVNYMSKTIAEEPWCLMSMKEIFEDFDIETDGNMLWDYAVCVMYFIAQKKGIVDPESIRMVTGSRDFMHCVNNNTIFKGRAIL